MLGEAKFNVIEVKACNKQDMESSSNSKDTNHQRKIKSSLRIQAYSNSQVHLNSKDQESEKNKMNAELQSPP